MKKVRVLLSIIFIAFVAFNMISLQSCKPEDDFNTDPNFLLEFNKDTVLFDTVFTTVGSVTKSVVIYNNSNKDINITQIYLAGGNSSQFSLNIDGIAANTADDIKIKSEDSLFVFVRVTVDPNNSSSPLVITDSIVFNINGNIQDIDLVAWGQDAYYHTPTDTITYVDGSGFLYGFAGCATPWKVDKPHVIYGYCVVDEDSTLTIPAGANIYMHNNSILWIYEGGSLKINGDVNNPVTFQGDRLEAWYEDTPGQWGKIWLSSLSVDNEINYAIIRNGSIGIQVDTVGNSNPTLVLNNTIIENMSAAALYGLGSTIEANNCVFSNCGQYSVILSYGGNYIFNHCTIDNHWTYAVRQTPALLLNNWYESAAGNVIGRDISAVFNNCVVYGNNDEEVIFDAAGTGTFACGFVNCLLKTTTTNLPVYQQCLFNTDPKYIDYTVNDFHLDTLSPLIDAGDPALLPFVPKDIEDNLRDALPDIGAYERM